MNLQPIDACCDSIPEFLNLWTENSDSKDSDDHKYTDWRIIAI